MTYTLVPKSGNEFSFQREESAFPQIVFIVGGLLIVFFAILVPTYAFLKFLLIVFGLGFFGAAFYLPGLGKRFSPDVISIDKARQEVVIAMADGSYCKISFSQIEDVEIAVEKRSPSAANSAGVHYLHYHINIKRANSATFTITSTTNKQEAEQTCALLKQALKHGSSSPSKIEYQPPNKIQVQQGEPLEMRWQMNRYELSLGKALIYSEYNSSGKPEVIKEFPVANFSRVEYTYANTIQNKNFSVYIHFDAPEPVKLGLFLKDLNPVECLQFENWLHQHLSERKNAIA